MNDDKLIVALDYPSEADAKHLAVILSETACIYKVGLQLYTKAGPSIVKAVQSTGHRIFLDLKLHDIPNTVAKATMEATRLGIFMLTLHALGGREMLTAAVQAADETSQLLSVPRPKLLAVTILTSHKDLQDQGITQSIPEMVQSLARLAQEAGCDGVVCSPQEIALVRDVCGPDFLIVTPGIRLADDDLDDQQRVATPQAAFEAGASYIVVGRPITRAADPLAAAQRITAAIN